MKDNNLSERLIAYEQGDLTKVQEVQLFQELVDSGLAWNLQGHYGRTAYAMLEAGWIST